MDCSPGIENYAMFMVLSTKELMLQEIDKAASELLLVHLAEAVSLHSLTQARRLRARFIQENQTGSLCCLRTPTPLFSLGLHIGDAPVRKRGSSSFFSHCLDFTMYRFYSNWQAQFLYDL